MKKGTQIKSHIRAATDMNRSVMILGHETSGKLTLEKKLESSEDIILKANSSTIINMKDLFYREIIFYFFINKEIRKKKVKKVIFIKSIKG